MREREKLLDVAYGDVDAGIVGEITRKVYPAVDILMEAQRKILGMSMAEMTNRRRKAEAEAKVGQAASMIMTLLLILLSRILSYLLSSF